MNKLISRILFPAMVLFLSCEKQGLFVRYEKDLCEKPCYYVYDNKVDLRIKYN